MLLSELIKIIESEEDVCDFTENRELAHIIKERKNGDIYLHFSWLDVTRYTNIFNEKVKNVAKNYIRLELEKISPFDATDCDYRIKWIDVRPFRIQRYMKELYSYMIDGTLIVKDVKIQKEE